MPRTLFPKRIESMMDTHRWLRSAVWIIEAVPFVMMCVVFRLMPVAVASRAGAAFMGLVGPRIGTKHRHIRNNLSIVLRHASGKTASGKSASGEDTSTNPVDEAELEATAHKVWRNLGAVIAEYPHLERIVHERTHVSVPESVAALIANQQPIVFLSGHLANWEIVPLILAERGVAFTVVYSPQANPLIERVIGFLRRAERCEFVPKLDAARELLRAAAGGRSVGVLADLRVDNGPELPFFGIAAPTTTVPARIAQRHRFPVVAVHVVREQNSRFRVLFEEPWLVDPADDHAASATTLLFLQALERWITRHPGQWLCTKRRWPRQRPAQTAAVTT